MICDKEVDWLGRWNLYSPHREAVYDYKNKTSYTYHQLWTLSLHLSIELSKLGIKFGDRVGVVSPNRVETLILFFSLQRLGAILVPINFRLTGSEIQHIIQDSDPKIVFYDSDSPTLNINSNLKTTSETELSLIPFTKLSEILNSKSNSNSEYPLQLNSEFHSKFDDPCMILYTSGTTGFPKGAVLTHKMLFWNAINTTLSLNITQEDVTINFAPLFHTGGWNVLLTPFLFRGARTILFEKFDPDEILKVASQEKVTLLFGVPTMLSMMSDVAEFNSTDLSSIRYMVVGGEPMPLDLIHIWNNKGIPIRQGFGLTEFGPNCFSLSESEAQTKMGSIGRPNFFVKTKIIDDQGEEVQVNQIGELLLSGPSCMQGYWNNPEATNETIKNGWLHTGDLVRQDENQYFYVVGRKKDMFISGGENVYPVEVEKVLRSHDNVSEAAVIGVKDPKWGEVGHAFVVCKKINFNEMELKDYCRKNLASFKVPKYFTWIKELPKGDSGKINKKILHTWDLTGVRNAEM